MKKFFSRFSRTTTYDEEEAEDYSDDYVELDTARTQKKRPKTVVRPFTVTEFRDAKEIIKVYRRGKTICMLNIHPLKREDMVELKRFINKVKKTVEAVDGDLAGFGEDQVVLVPSHVKIHKSAPAVSD